MRKLIQGRPVACEFRGHDRYSRLAQLVESIWGNGEYRQGLGVHAV
jgi:hypothetical protein